MGSGRSNIGSGWPDLRSKRSDLRSERPNVGLTDIIWGERPILGLESPGLSNLVSD